MRHNAVMGVVAVACVAVINGQALGPMGRLHHHKGERTVAHNQHVAGMGFLDDEVLSETPDLTFSNAQLGLAGLLTFPKFTADAPDDGPEAPPLGANIGFGRPVSGLGAVARSQAASAPPHDKPRQDKAPQDPPPPEPPPKPASPPAAPWVEAALTPDKPVPPPVPPVVVIPPIVVVPPIIVVPPPVSPPPPAPVLPVIRLAAAAPAPIPEPATWMMMLLGFSATAAALRRRRRSAGLSTRVLGAPR